MTLSPSQRVVAVEPDTQPVLAALGVRKSFRAGERRLEVLHGIDLTLGPGELLCLMGSSGAGKTTLLNVLGLLDRPTEGQVLLEGRDAWSLGHTERARLPEVLATGITRVAVGAAVTEADDPHSAARELLGILEGPAAEAASPAATSDL